MTKRVRAEFELTRAIGAKRAKDKSERELPKPKKPKKRKPAAKS